LVQVDNIRTVTVAETCLTLTTHVKSLGLGVIFDSHDMRVSSFHFQGLQLPYLGTATHPESAAS